MKKLANLTHWLAWATFCTLFAAGVAGCSGTKAAYRAAENLDETAFVVAEHYSAVLTEARILVQKPETTAGTVRAVQRIEAKATPIIIELADVRNQYIAIRVEYERIRALYEAGSTTTERMVIIADNLRDITSRIETLTSNSAREITELILAIREAT